MPAASARGVSVRLVPKVARVVRRKVERYILRAGRVWLSDES
jgi:hypothetical protein